MELTTTCARNWRATSFFLDCGGKTPSACRVDCDERNEESFFSPQSRPDNQARRILLIERTSHGVRDDLGRILASRVGVSSSFLASHDSVGPMFNASDEHIRSLRLPSSLSPEKNFHVDFFQLIEVEDKDVTWFCPLSRQQVSPETEGLTMVSSATGRQLQFHRWRDRGGWLVIVPVRLSFCAIGAWDAVLVTEPLPERAILAHEGTSLAPRTIDLRRKTSFLSYENFIPGTTQYPPPAPAPKLDLYDDVCHYVDNHAGLLASVDPAARSTWFPLKIIASHFCVLHSLVAFQTMGMVTAGWSLHRESKREMRDANDVQESWSKFRGGVYLLALESIMDSLKIPYEAQPPPENYFNRTLVGPRPARLDGDDDGGGDGSSTTSTTTGSTAMSSVTREAWAPPAADFIYLHRQFTQRRIDYDRVTTSIAALMGIITGRIGVVEAQVVKALAYIAILVAPPSLVAGIFSMTDKFAPDSAMFWRYWVVAIPTTLLVCAVFAAWHWQSEVRQRARQTIRQGMQAREWV